MLVEAWSAWGCAWTSLGFLPPLSQEEVEKEGDWFWLPLCNYYHPPPTPTPTLMQANIEEGVCWAFAALLTQWAGRVFRVPVPYLNVWILVSPSRRVALIVLLLSQKSHWVERTECWVNFQEPSKKWPIRTPFWYQVCGKGCPSTGHTRNTLSVSWCRGCWNLQGKHILFQRFLLQPLDCLSLFFKAPNSTWHLVFLGNETRHEECERGERWPRKEAKPFFPFTFLLIREFGLTLTCCWNPSHMLGPSAKCEVNCSSENNRFND